MSGAERAGRGGDDAGSSKGFGGTEDGADVVWIFDGVEDDDQRGALRAGY